MTHLHIPVPAITRGTLARTHELKTIHAQRENAGLQCVAMRLHALIYSTIRKIASVDDMIEIMIVGYQ